MSKHAIAVSFCLMLTASTIANAQWALQSPIPTGRHLNSVYFLTPSHGFAVGENRYLLETMDSGASWLTRMSDVLGTLPFYSILFSDAQHGFITGTGSDSWRTTDGGITWAQMSNIGEASWYHLDFITPTSGFVGSNGACSFTSDGGATWVAKSVYPDCPIMYGMDFRDERVGLACSEGIFKTTNGGVFWQQMSSLVANDVLWWSDNVALATSGTEIYRSTNSGDSWTLLATDVTDGLLEFVRVNSVTLAGVSSKGDIWRSSDEGVTWTRVLDGLGDLPALWSIHFADAQHGWVVGQSGFMYATDDGGLTWRQVNSGAGVQIYDMEMNTASFGIAVCHNGYVFRTTNGGNRWEVQKLEVTGQIFGRDESLHGVSIVDSGFAVAAGPGGTVFRTYNGGVSWESVGYPNLPDPFWIEDVKFVTRTDGWVVGLDQDIGHGKSVYRTTNGGTTWIQAMDRGSYMWAVEFVDTQHGWIATTGPLYFRTTNGGTTWVEGVFPPYFITPTVSDIRFANQNVGWAVGWDGFVARTLDGGASWTYQNLGTTEEHFFSIHVASANEAWLTGRESNVTMNGVVYHTTNGGNTWTREITSPYPYWGYAISGAGRDVWIAGYEGKIFKKQFPTGVGESNPGTLPVQFSLAQNYPNPFNPSTSIGFQIAQPGHATLKVYDVLGRRVATLFDEHTYAGDHVVTWNAAGVGSGTYFCRLESNGRVAIRRMLLVK